MENPCLRIFDISGVWLGEERLRGLVLGAVASAPACTLRRGAVLWGEGEFGRGVSPKGRFSAGGVGSTSFLCVAQSVQATWKTSYNSALRKVYDFLYSCSSPLLSLLPDTDSTGYLNLRSYVGFPVPARSSLDRIPRRPCRGLSHVLGEGSTYRVLKRHSNTYFIHSAETEFTDNAKVTY